LVKVTETARYGFAQISDGLLSQIGRFGIIGPRYA
jgi:hypothetical protein